MINIWIYENMQIFNIVIATCILQLAVSYTAIIQCISLSGGAVAQWVECWACDQQVVGSNPTQGKAV